MVVVTVNCRLNALGFLAHPDLRDPDTGAAANWGVQDQAAALRWVRDNIAAFGGDPGNVTLFGQSAGGTSVANLLQNAPEAGAVRRAIIQSGAIFGPPLLPDVEGAARYAEALAQKLGTTVGKLVDVPAATLHATELALAREWQTERNGWRVPILPIVDGTVIRTAPRDAGLPAIPLLIGSNRSEATFWYDLVGPDGKTVPGLPAPQDEAALATMLRSLAQAYRPQAEDLPPETILAAYREAAARGAPTGVKSLWLALYTDLRYRLDATARRHAAAGHSAFLYEFAHPPAPPAHGVSHCAEIPFAFGTNADPYFVRKSGTGATETALATATMQAWAHFARDGVPASDEGGAWTPVSASGEVINVLGGPEGPRRALPVLRPEELAA